MLVALSRAGAQGVRRVRALGSDARAVQAACVGQQVSLHRVQWHGVKTATAVFWIVDLRGDVVVGIDHPGPCKRVVATARRRLFPSFRSVVRLIPSAKCSGME